MRQESRFCGAFMTVIAAAKNGMPTIIKDGAYLLSSYDPVREMQRFIEKTVPEKTGEAFYILFGSLLGYGLEILLKRGAEPQDIFIYENDPVCLDFFRKAYPDFPVATGGPADPLPFEKLMMEHKRPLVLSPESVSRAYPGEYGEFTDFIGKAIRAAAENIKVTSYFSKVWFMNFARNLSLFAGDDGARCLRRGGAAVDVPILVAAAGPSLDNALGEIRSAMGNIIIMSVLSAARGLLKAGIKPDFIVMSDAGVYNGFHGAGLPADVPVLSSVFASSALLKSMPNRKVFYDLEEALDGSFGVKYPSVTIDAGMIARSITGGPVIFAGFDLAYSVTAGTHSRGNAFDEYFMYKSDRLHTVPGHSTDFLKRKDLIPLDRIGMFTSGQFSLVRETAEKLFEGCSSLSRGVEFSSLERIRKIKGGPAGEKEAAMRNISGLFSRDAEILRRIKTESCSIREELKMLNRGLCRRIFTREYMGGTGLEEFCRVYERKMNKLFG